MSEIRKTLKRDALFSALDIVKREGNLPDGPNAAFLVLLRLSYEVTRAYAEMMGYQKTGEPYKIHCSTCWQNATLEMLYSATMDFGNYLSDTLTHQAMREAWEAASIGEIAEAWEALPHLTEEDREAARKEKDDVTQALRGRSPEALLEFLKAKLAETYPGVAINAKVIDSSDLPEDIMEQIRGAAGDDRGIEIPIDWRSGSLPATEGESEAIGDSEPAVSASDFPVPE